jgi:hypothetical protein
MFWRGRVNSGSAGGGEVVKRFKVAFREHAGLRAAVGASVALCGIVATLAATPGSARTPAVLAAKEDLPAGTVLTADDLQEVYEAQPGAEAAPASSESSFLGKTLHVELPAGMLLGPGDIGVYPPSGFAQVSLALKPGQYPANLVNGQRVGILPLAADGSGPYSPGAAAGSAAGGAGPQVVDGQLVSMAADGSSGQSTEIANVLVPVAQAATVMSAPGAALMGLNGAGR